MSNKDKLKIFINQNKNITCFELDNYFNQLDPISIEKMKGEWRIGYLFTKDSTNNVWEKIVKYVPIRPYSKIFTDKNNIKAWVFRIFGIKLAFQSTILRKNVFRGKVSASMIYKRLSMVDYFREIDNETVMGIMEVKGKLSLYFYLLKIAEN